MTYREPTEEELAEDMRALDAYRAAASAINTIKDDEPDDDDTE